MHGSDIRIELKVEDLDGAWAKDTIIVNVNATNDPPVISDIPKFEVLENELNCSKENLNKAFEVISNLNPKPGEGSPTTTADYILPDLIVEEIEGKLIVSVNDGNIPEIGLSLTYQNLIQNAISKNDELKKFLKNKVESAKWFVQAVQQRQITIVKVMEAIIFRQDYFFRGDTYSSDFCISKTPS